MMKDEEDDGTKCLRDDDSFDRFVFFANLRFANTCSCAALVRIHSCDTLLG
jgi:hypothetical protein